MLQISPDEGCCPIRAPRSRDREREEYRGQRAGDAQFQGNRQWVSGQLTPAANRAAAAAGMSSSAKTRCRSGSTAQVNGLTRVMTASQSRTDQTHLRAVWPSVTLPRRRTERLGERLSTQRYASLATWQSRLRAQRMVGRPEYLYIAVARDGRPHLPRGGHLGIPHKGGAGLRLYPRSDPSRRIKPGPCPGGRAARRDASGSAAAAGRDQVAGGQPGGPAGGLHGDREQQPRRLVFPGRRDAGA